MDHTVLRGLDATVERHRETREWTTVTVPSSPGSPGPSGGPKTGLDSTRRTPPTFVPTEESGGPVRWEWGVVGLPDSAPRDPDLGLPSNSSAGAVSGTPAPPLDPSTLPNVPTPPRSLVPLPEVGPRTP